MDGPFEIPPAGREGFDALDQAKRLLRTVRAGSLATLAPEGPFASLTSVATLPDGSPLLLLSRLAAHTGHLLRERRCSLLLAPGGKGDPLAHPRLTLVGEALEAQASERAEWRTRFLRRHPKAALYADFPDFSFWRLALHSGHLNGGFGRAVVLAASALRTETAGAEALLAAADGIVEAMNRDPAEVARLGPTRLAGEPDRPWRVTGVDPDGLDLAWGDESARVSFAERVTTPEALRLMLSGAGRVQTTK